MRDFLPGAVNNIGMDRRGDNLFAPIHPRLLPVAQAKIERLRKSLRAGYANAVKRLEMAVAYVRVFIVKYNDPGAKAILSELEKALADIRALAASEVLDISGIRAIERRLMLVQEDLEALHENGADGMLRGDDENRTCG